MHALDNVIWQALTTRHARFAEGFGPARRFVREVSPLTAFEEENPEGYAALAGLVGVDGTAALFLDGAYEPRPGWELLAGVRCCRWFAKMVVSGPDRILLRFSGSG